MQQSESILSKDTPVLTDDIKRRITMIIKKGLLDKIQSLQNPKPKRRRTLNFLK